MTNWSFQPIMNSYWVVTLLAIGLFLTLLVGPTFRRLSVGRRRTLLILRVLVVLLVIIILLRPTHVSLESKTQTAVLLVLFDQSRSMQLPNTSGSHSRWDAQVTTLRQILPQALGVEVAIGQRQHPLGHPTQLIQAGAQPCQVGQARLPFFHACHTTGHRLGGKGRQTVQWDRSTVALLQRHQPGHWPQALPPLGAASGRSHDRLRVRAASSRDLASPAA